ncbi:T-complex protein 1, eta subunit [Vittaforma corneae ATCC 50505]|uniref:CCT-eta n=1 Tax=Vittaforma corneae (strain ATCC 50505) TaxID=993615 RepID=L2GPF6_VITCO|nr:T-complex protein 1, eta subunit [Vittaforma corneae ATCC 50505]ELA42711.1 T-complex protein 1, eta subunit [Vittaforma corneae ATCC 50505]
MVQYLFQPEKVLDCRSGISHIISNIEACTSVANSLSATFGPYGLDKLFYGKKLLLTNDGATILENMNFKHPIAKLLCSLSKSQDNEVGDGTTSVVLLTSAILNSLLSLVKEEFSTEIIRNVLKDMKRQCLERLENLKIEFSEENLIRLAETCLNSKNVRGDKSHFSRLLVDALSCDDDLYIDKVTGGSLSDSFLVPGIAFKKTFTYAGYEQQPKKILNPKICCLNIELEWKSERENAEIKIESVEEYQRVVDAEWKIITEKLDDIINSGANVVLSTMSIGDYATQYFARAGIFSAGRVHELPKIVKAFKGKISNSTKYIKLGTCELFEERQLGETRYNYFEGKNARSRTLILRGPGSEILEEVERAVHDAVCVIKTAIKHQNIVCGGGSVEMQLSKLCRDLSFKIGAEKMFVYRALSMAFEKIPSQLAANFGLDPVSVLQNLRQSHSTSNFTGVSLKGTEDMTKLGVLEPLEVKKNMVKAAFDAADTILSIDSTIINKK